MIHASAYIHPTAIIEEGISIGAGTSVWNNVHIRANSVIGNNCIIGEKTYIAYDVIIGNGVKINSFVYICAAVTIEDQVMISAGTIFTNDRFPRAFDPDGSSLKTSNPTDETLETNVRRGVTIGAGCTVGPGIDLSEYCMVGMGSVVTRNVAPYQLVYGNPAKLKGVICLCGEVIAKYENDCIVSGEGTIRPFHAVSCSKCQRQFSLSDDNYLLRQKKSG